MRIDHYPLAPAIADWLAHPQLQPQRSLAANDALQALLAFASSIPLSITHRWILESRLSAQQSGIDLSFPLLRSEGGLDKLDALLTQSDAPGSSVNQLLRCWHRHWNDPQDSLGRIIDSVWLEYDYPYANPYPAGFYCGGPALSRLSGRRKQQFLAAWVEAVLPELNAGLSQAGSEPWSASVTLRYLGILSRPEPRLRICIGGDAADLAPWLQALADESLIDLALADPGKITLQLELTKSAQWRPLAVEVADPLVDSGFFRALCQQRLINADQASALSQWPAVERQPFTGGMGLKVPQHIQRGEAFFARRGSLIKHLSHFKLDLSIPDLALAERLLKVYLVSGYELQSTQ